MGRRFNCYGRTFRSPNLNLMFVKFLLDQPMIPSKDLDSAPVDGVCIAPDGLDGQNLGLNAACCGSGIFR